MRSQKEKWKSLPFEKKAIFSAALAGVALLAIAILIACLRGDITIVTDYTAAAWELGCRFFSTGVLMLLFALCMAFVLLLGKYVDFDVIHSAMHRIGIDLSNSILTRNAKVYSYRIGYFLFGVLSRNNETLHLPLGEDFTCLTPRAFSYTSREKCIFYHFDLITPQMPEMDTATLRKIIQSFIEVELYNYGIVGLGSRFYSKALNCSYYSVYLDRITYSEKQHRLTFDVLYVCTETAAEYVAKAIQRDAIKVQVEREIYDDEI